MKADPLASIATRLGMPSGALYTLVVGYVLVLALTLTGPTAAFSNTSAAPAANSGLGNLAVAPVTVPTPAPAPPTTIPAPSTPEPPVTTAFVPIPAPSTTRPAAPAPTGAPPVAASEPDGPGFGDLVASASIPGRVTAVTSVAGGVLVAVDRDDADPLIVRLDADGEEVGSVVVSGRDLSGETDIVDLAVDAFGRVVALVNGPAEVLLVDGDRITSAGVIGDLPPCALPLPIAVPVACEPGAEDNAIDVDSVVVAGDRIIASDPGQGVLWSIDAEGAVVAAHIDEANRAGDDALGVRGLVALPGGVVLATRNDELVEFTLDDDAVTTEAVARLDAPALGLDRGGDGSLAVLSDDGTIVRLDRRLTALEDLPVASRSISDLAVSSDGLWVTQPRSGGAASDVNRYLLEERTS